MTEREALKLALEALENNKLNHLYCEDTWYSCPKHEDGCANEAEGDECNCGADEVNAQFDNAITAIKEALAQPEQEPVAVKHMMEWVEYLKRQSDHGQHLHIPSGMSAGTCWELARELEQFINTTPPHRTWVGLTEEEVEACFHHVDEAGIGLFDFAEAVEAKLKQKNGYAEEKNT